MDNSIPLILARCAFLGIGIYVLYWFERQAEEICVLMMTRWLKRDNLELVESSRRWFHCGPFSWGIRLPQRVFRIKVKEPSGDIREGWACCGGLFLGVFGDKVIFQLDSLH